MEDRVGVGWRGELAGGILAHLDRIDVVEVIAEDWFEAPRKEVRALQTLGAQVPIWIHGVSLGLASAAPADRRRIDRMARVVGLAEPEGWSEHLAFVRGGAVEIGHLAAPPRNDGVLEGLARNAEAARRAVGSPALLENVATLLDPPGSDRCEAAFLRDAGEASGCGLLLDLHNWFANGTNFGFDPLAGLHHLPLDRVGMIHVAGGRWIRSPAGRPALLDDHLHPVPDPVYALLEETAARSDRPLTVVLERDGRWPEIGVLLAELDRVRGAVARGRARREVPA